MAKRHERIEYGSLAGFNEGWREEVRGSAGVEVEEMSTDGDTEVLLAFELKGSVGEMGKGEICGGLVGFGEPALMCREIGRAHV